MEEEAQTPLIGSIVGGRYRILRQMGAGGMGAVYEAIQEDLNRRVAVKLLHEHLARDLGLVQRFKREAQAAAALGHPNIVHVTDFQVNPGEPPFLVMEYLSGKSLREVMREETQLAPKRVAFIATQVLSALAAAHEAKIVHRDIKPDNLFLTSTSVMQDIVKVLDFGIAKLLQDNDEGPLTVAGTVLGTLSYMAPEQARGQVVDARTDLYALGACMYHAIAGRRPLEAVGRGALHAAILAAEPVALSLARPDVDAGLAVIVHRALAKDPEKRYASAREMAAALTAWLELPVASSTTVDPPTEVDPAPATQAATPAALASFQHGAQADAPSEAKPTVRERPLPDRGAKPTMLSAQPPVAEADPGRGVPSPPLAVRQVTQPLAASPTAFIAPQAKTPSVPPPRSPATVRAPRVTNNLLLWVFLGVASFVFVAGALGVFLYARSMRRETTPLSSAKPAQPTPPESARAAPTPTGSTQSFTFVPAPKRSIAPARAAPPATSVDAGAASPKVPAAAPRAAAAPSAGVQVQLGF